jgi:hypothetical protein
MKRRMVLSLLGGAAESRPVGARAQQSGNVARIGFLGQSTSLGESERAAKFAQRLRELGWIEGQTVAIEYRWAEPGRQRRQLRTLPPCTGGLSACDGTGTIVISGQLPHSLKVSPGSGKDLDRRHPS